jgi:hypothetical protein
VSDYDYEAIPATQHASMMKHINTQLGLARGKLKGAKTPKERRIAEDDVSGLEVMRARIGTWKLVDKNR